MKLWIIGKRGLLARAFQRICMQKGIEIVVTSKKEVDVCNKAALEAQFETLHFTHVINCSGYTAVDHAEIESKEAHALNVQAVKNLAILAKKRAKKLCHFSTDYVFNGKKKEGYTETCLPSPLSVYGKTKEEGERELFTHYDKACLIRTSWLFGKEGNNFLTRICEQVEKKKIVKVVSDQVGSPTFVDDLVFATLDLLEESGIFHLANRGRSSRYEWACAIYQRVKEKKRSILCQEVIPVSTVKEKGKAERPSYSALVTSRYESVTKKSMRPWKEAVWECLP